MSCWSINSIFTLEQLLSSYSTQVEFYPNTFHSYLSNYLGHCFLLWLELNYFNFKVNILATLPPENQPAKKSCNTGVQPAEGSSVEKKSCEATNTQLLSISWYWKEAKARPIPACFGLQQHSTVSEVFILIVRCAAVIGSTRPFQILGLWVPRPNLFRTWVWL